MKKLLILYASYGNGHKAIANYVEDYFSKNDEYEILTIDLLNYSYRLPGLLTKMGSQITMFYTPKVWDLFFCLTNNKLVGNSLYKFHSKIINNKKLKKLISEFNPDVIISTHFFTTPYAAEFKKNEKKNVKIITVVTDYYVHPVWLESSKYVDVFIVNSLDDKVSLMMKRNFSEDKVKPYGMPISPKYVRAKYDKTKLMKKFNLTGERPIALYYAGGGNGSMASIPYLLSIVQNRIDADIFFVCGKNKELKLKAEAIVRRNECKNIRVLGFITNGPEYMSVADFVITKPGGITVTECLCFNKPMILTKGAGGQESKNYKYMIKKGYAINADNLFKFKKILKRISTNEKYLEKLEKNVQKVNRSSSMEKLYKLVESYFDLQN